MVAYRQPGRLSDEDFSTVLEALSATAKGRHFLAEYIRRSRPPETRMLLDALQRIEAHLHRVREQLQPERIAGELRRVAAMLATAEAARSGGSRAAAELLALIESAVGDLLALAESLEPPDGAAPAPRPESARARLEKAAVFAPPRLGGGDVIQDDLPLLDPAPERPAAPPSPR